MKESHRPGLRTAALGAAGAAALVAAGLWSPASPGRFGLAVVGGFALGVAATALGSARTGARVEAAAPRPEHPQASAPPPAGAVVLDQALDEDAGAAAVAPTVAAVAHHMSNPLASLRSNLEWLRDALEAGRLDGPEEQAEAREVLRDAREAAERLRVDVGALRAVGQRERESPPPDA